MLTLKPILPTEPGLYHWSEWNMVVKLYTKGSSKNGPLYVQVPGKHGGELKITPRIAGTFKPI